MKLTINVNAIDLGRITPFLLHNDVALKVVECTTLQAEGALVFYVVNMLQFELTLELNENCDLSNPLLELLTLLSVA